MNDVTKDLLERITDISKMYERFGATCVFEGQPMMHLSHLEEIAELAARAEAALAEPQPDADGWIPWAGGDCPLERRVRHQVRFRYGDESHWSKCPYGWNWEHTGAPTDIIAYRIVEAKP